MITAGIDCGAKNTKTVILKDGAIIGKGKVLSGYDRQNAVESSFAKAIDDARILREDIQRICSTGSGRNSVKIAEDTIEDVEAMAKGAFFFFPTARTVADVGAEEGRAAKLDAKGNAVDFAVNEKCAAGAGAFIESMARALDVGVEEMGPMCLESDAEIPLNAQCVIFAESEAVGLIHSKTPKADISRAIHDSIAGRIASIIRRIGVNKDVVLIGGLGHNPGIVRAIKRELKLDNILVPEAPEFGAAVGAAVAAAEELQNQKIITKARKGENTKKEKLKSDEKRDMAEEQKKEFWRWTESNWVSPDIRWQNAQHVTVGIDVGSVSTQAVIMSDGKIYAYSNMRTGYDSPSSALNALNFALKATDGLTADRINYCIGTGYGRVNVPFADRSITEIACHARGANFIYGPRVRTVLDVGGQDIKAIQCDEKGKVNNFLMNDKCAAGTGRGMEVFADLLNIPIEEVGVRSFSYEGDEPEAVSNTCVVYAKSEAIDLLRRGWSEDMVLAAYCRAMAQQIYRLVERLGVRAEFAVTGGMAKNCGVMDRLMPTIGLERMETEWDAQIAGAVGAALFGYAMCMKGRAR